MDYVKLPHNEYEAMIKTLKDAVNVCYNVDSSDEDIDRSYPFATGYSRSAMQQVLKTLELLK